MRCYSSSVRSQVRADPYYGSYLPQLVRCALALGDRVLAAGLVEGTAASTPLIEHCLATARAALSEAAHEQEAASLYAAVAAHWNEFGNVIEQAHALLGQGRCMVDTGDPSAAEPLQQARELFAALGFDPAVAETDALRAQSR